ncbi:hypothetical protein LYNGBM3L_66370 [Moorena producens 3L]|uniref:Uncharacterized protein n=1 Tax=Moorena producens 3L TaxID=489825 RepID=F4Y1H5_9CYAN|nr:hypothetical protein LYNGBM3L_66370 [Moorena producens 3L]OLT64102.1 hypothetical protein BI334_02840 [Moorena producens 3L]
MGYPAAKTDERCIDFFQKSGTADLGTGNSGQEFTKSDAVGQRGLPPLALCIKNSIRKLLFQEVL